MTESAVKMPTLTHTTDKTISITRKDEKVRREILTCNGWEEDCEDCKEDI